MLASRARRALLSRVALAALFALVWPSFGSATSGAARKGSASKDSPVRGALSVHAAVPSSAQAAPSTAAATTASVRFSESLVLKARIGKKPGQVGFAPAGETASIAPMGFAVLPEERILLLDQENQRLQVFKSGKFERVVPLDLTTYEDVVRWGKDRIALLDRQRTGTLLVLTYDGTVEKRMALVGQGLTEAAAAESLVVRSDGLWVAVPPNLMRFLMPDGSEDDSRKLVRGPTTTDGSEIVDVAEKKGLLVLSKRSQSGVVRISDEHPLPPKARLSGDRESDRAGNIYVGVSGRGARNETRSLLYVFDADLKKLGEVALDVGDTQGAVSSRKLVIDDNGDVYWMNWTRSEIKIWRYRAIHG